MGYQQGKGLGANKQGIVEPIQPKVRPGRGAVGAYGAEAKGPKFGGNICTNEPQKFLSKKLLSFLLKNYDFLFLESAAEAQQRIGGVSAATEEEASVPQLKRGNWKKENVKKSKIRYKTLEEVIKEGDGVHKYSLNVGQGIKVS